MSFLSGIGDLLKQYGGGNPSTTNVEQHFDQLTQSLPSSSIASGLAEALHSGQAGSFPQIAAQLFSNGDGSQRAGMLTSLLAAAGPAVISQFTSGHPSSHLTALLQSGQTSPESAVTPAQAASVPAADIAALAQHAHNENPSIVDRMSAVYAEHPTLVKTLGAAILAETVKRIAERHSA